MEAVQLGGGKHVKVLIHGVAFSKLVDVPGIRNFLVKAVRSVGMRELASPHVYDIKKALEKQNLKPDPDEPEGVTGIVVLSTSHASIHTWPHREYAVIDVYSCRDFSKTILIEEIRRSFRPKHMKVTDLSASLIPDLIPVEELERGLANGSESREVTQSDI